MVPGQPFFLVPLHWKRELGLAAEHQLEAWYAWRGPDYPETWRLDPHDVLQATTVDAFYARQLIYPAELDVHTRSRRLSCEGLLRNLGHRSNFQLWLASEPESIAIWTDAAFQIWFGRLGGLI